MRNISLLLTFALYLGTASSNTVIIKNSGDAFSSDSVSITAGDSVKFVIASIHDAVEVSQATWNANGTTKLPGFSTPFGGGLVLPTQLTVGTHWYVCTKHAAMGMKGIIMVKNATGIAETKLEANILVYPNPSFGQFTIGNLLSESEGYDLRIYNIVGEKVYFDKITSLSSYVLNLDLPTGVYFLQMGNNVGTEVKKIIIR